MAIGILSRWGATCGISMHAELIAPYLGDVRILAPYVESASRWWHHKTLREDEEYVIRCYWESTPEGEEGRLDFGRIPTEELDALIVESYRQLPQRDVERLVDLLHRRGVPSLVIIHEGFSRDIRYKDINRFDRILIFDHRYKEILPKTSKVSIVPYPCFPLSPGTRTFAEDGIKLISFGRQPVGEFVPFFQALQELSKTYDFQYLVIRSNGELSQTYPWLRQERRRLQTTQQVYEVLHRNDIHLIPKGDTAGVVVSSTLCQCLGSLVPSVVPFTRHFELHGEEVVKFRDVNDLMYKLKRLIEDEDFRSHVKRSAAAYVLKNSAAEVAKKIRAILRVV